MNIISILLLLAASFSFGVAFGGAAAGKTLAAECEAELPRNERCIVIAVPEKGE